MAASKDSFFMTNKGLQNSNQGQNNAKEWIFSVYYVTEISQSYESIEKYIECDMKLSY